MLIEKWPNIIQIKEISILSLKYNAEKGLQIGVKFGYMLKRINVNTAEFGIILHRTKLTTESQL
jgi:hypothetical protein